MQSATTATTSTTPEALERGDRVANFVLADLKGAFRLFYDLTQGGPGLVALCDGADPAAQTLLAGMSARAAALKALGAELFAVVAGAPERVAALARDAAGGEPPFPVLVDAEAKVNRVYPVAGETRGLKLVLIDPNQRALAGFAGAAPEALIDDARAWLERHWRAAAPVAGGRPAPILLVPDAFDPALCRALIDAWHGDHAELGVSGSTDALLYDRKKSQDHVVRDPDMARRISRTLNRRIAPEVLKAFTFKGPYGFDGHIVLGYDAGRRDFFGPHRDNMSPRTRHRRFAISLNLNDDFEGGELRFSEYGGALYRMDAGMACVFSCSLLHEAMPVRKGRRFVLTTFMCDPTGSQGAR
ncbi:MAG: 2OG-Fe(II) oxygenase [Alphaproteobacteria bacterium]|nr:2OG-Fe(II) oxygenase [Alphaproteobacteria bacterium]